MALPVNHPFNTIHLTGYTPSCGGTPVSAYFRAPFRGRVRTFSGILGGAITTADGTITVTNVTQSATIGTFTVTQSGSAAGQFQSGTPTSDSVAWVNEDDVIRFTPSAASGANIPMHFGLSIRQQ